MYFNLFYLFWVQMHGIFSSKVSKIFIIEVLHSFWVLHMVETKNPIWAFNLCGQLIVQTHVLSTLPFHNDLLSHLCDISSCKTVYFLDLNFVPLVNIFQACVNFILILSLVLLPTLLTGRHILLFFIKNFLVSMVHWIYCSSYKYFGIIKIPKIVGDFCWNYIHFPNN